MARTERFEDLLVWQRARALTTRIYAVTRLSAFRRDFALSRQIQRASVSIMANVAEGFERFGSAEFAHFISIAKASCAEVRSLLYVALDVGHIDQQAFDDLMGQAEQVGRLCGGLHVALTRAQTAPRKHHRP